MDVDSFFGCGLDVTTTIFICFPPDTLPLAGGAVFFFSAGAAARPQPLKRRAIAPMPLTLKNSRRFMLSPYFSFAYSASFTGSSHSVETPSPDSMTERCCIMLFGPAPCQCFVPSGIVTTVPGRISFGSSPQIW